MERLLKKFKTAADLVPQPVLRLSDEPSRYGVIYYGSTGLSLHWQSPMGPMIINFAVPFRTQRDDGHYEERIQFTFGSTF